MSNQTEWRWADPTGQQRLVREDELRAALKKGVIPSNAPVWTRGWTGWKPAHDVAELTGKVEAAPTPEGDVPPPPNFIVAAQDAFEGKPRPIPAGPAEPPQPPRYVPIAPAPLASSAPEKQPDPPKAPPAVAPAPPAAPAVSAGPPAKPQTKPPPLPPGARAQIASKKQSIPPPLPPAAKRAPQAPATVTAKVTPPATVTIPMKTTGPATRAEPPKPNLAKTAALPGATGKPAPQQQQSAFTHTQRPPAGVAPPPEVLSASPRNTLPISPAPPPMPKAAPPAAPAASPAAAAPRETPPKEPNRNPTLLMFEDAPTVPTPAVAGPRDATEEAPPIVVPPPEPGMRTNAVTRPPPWGEGAVEMDTTIPKSARVPGVTPDTDSVRPRELSSSDLTSEARVAVVKAAPLTPAERPHSTIKGIGPDTLGESRAALEKAVRSPAPAPVSQSDASTTTKWQAQPEDVPEPPPSLTPANAKLDELRKVTAEQAQKLAAVARRGYDELRERTKDKPRWVLPVAAGSAAFVVMILFATAVKAIFGSSSGSSVATASSASSVSGAETPAPSVSAAPPAPAPATTHATGPGRPMKCETAGDPRTVAPKALVASGVEVVDVGGKIALGFAAAAKEATLEIVDPRNVSSLGSLHLPETARVRRVVGLDPSKMAVDVDRADDPLHERRTLRASTPIDVGSTDEGLAWAPLGSDNVAKLWSVPSMDQPVEALRGEPLPNGAGFAIAFRHAGAIWFGAFGGSPPAPLGSLLHVDGLGPKIGSPAIAASGDRMVVAWADRASKDDAWSIRYATFRATDSAAQAKSFSLQTDGAPEQAMSPALASLDGGRFLFVWTTSSEGPHSVRGAVLNADGAFSEPFTASAEGVNAGQGQAAVLPDGRGVVAFLAAAGKHVFEVHAAPIHCAEK